MKYLREWEHITDYTQRLKVPNGWLVFRKNSYPASSNVMCFVSDKDHSWELEEKD